MKERIRRRRMNPERRIQGSSPSCRARGASRDCPTAAGIGRPSCRRSQAPLNPNCSATRATGRPVPRNEGLALQVQGSLHHRGSLPRGPLSWGALCHDPIAKRNPVESGLTGAGACGIRTDLGLLLCTDSPWCNSSSWGGILLRQCQLDWLTQAQSFALPTRKRSASVDRQTPQHSDQGRGSWFTDRGARFEESPVVFIGGLKKKEKKRQMV